VIGRGFFDTPSNYIEVIDARAVNQICHLDRFSYVKMILHLKNNKEKVIVSQFDRIVVKNRMIIVQLTGASLH
jgi:hypothetical protein